MFWKRKNVEVFYNKKNFFVRNTGILLSIAVILGAFFIGFYAGEKATLLRGRQSAIKQLVNKDTKATFALSKDIDFNLFWKIWEKIKKDYAHQPVDEVKMFYGAVGGIAESLGDPYSVFLEPKLAEEFQQNLAGEFDGIGAELAIKNNIITVVAPLLDSPAEKAGIQAGDKILAIDGMDTSNMTLDYAVRLIRGKRGTKVKLTIAHDGFSSSREIEIMRDQIIVKSVQWRMEGDAAYVRILQFGSETISDFDKIIKSVVLKNPKGIILDLRNNPWGYLDAAVKMAGEWVPNDVVAYERYKGQDKSFVADGKGRLKDFKTIALINKGSASGSEIVAGALKDYGKATLVGERTFGKGSVQDYEEYSDGSALKLTIALWLTPKETSIDKEGIKPDIEVKITDDDYKQSQDTQLNRAKELLK